MTDKKAKQEQYTYLVPANVQPAKDYSTNIFAFTATLLIVNLISPAPGLPNQPHPTLFYNWHYFLIYSISFLTVSNYWYKYHNIFEHVIQINRTLIYLNIILLLSVTFLPYPAQLMGQYGNNSHVALLYGFTTSFTFLMFTLITWYILSNHQLYRKEINLPVKKVIIYRNILPLTFAILGTIMAYSFPRLSHVIYTITTMIFFAPFEIFIKEIKIDVPPAAND